MKLAPEPSLMMALGLAVCSSCTLLTPANVETRTEILDKTPLDLPQAKTHPGTLLVLAPEGSAVFDTTRMAYETRPHEIAYFSKTEWGERPSQMIHPLLVQALQRTHRFSTVVTPPFTGHFTHVLRTEILAIEQDFTSEPAALQLRLRVELVAEAENKVLGTKEISEREPMREKTPHGGAIAANDAMAKALKELAEFVLAKMA
jgi:cholesterol transport system auxiliary component